MKKNHSISRLAIICVMCAGVSGAYGASSVRSLGGAGTYSSASSASAAATTTTKSASSGSGTLAAARGGSVRLTPSTSAGKTATSAKVTAGSTGARAASTPRLSVGKYLGATTVLSGGSSTRPGGSTGGSGGGMDAGTAAELQKSVDELKRSVEELHDADDDLSSQLQDKQDTLNPRDGGYIEVGDNGEIYVDVDGLNESLESQLAETYATKEDLEQAILDGQVDLSDYAKHDEVKVKQDAANLTGSEGWSANSTDDTKYPSNKAVSEAIASAVSTFDSKLEGKVSQSTYDSHMADVDGSLQGLQSDVKGKADIVKSVEEGKSGNIATVDQNGQYQVSDKKFSDFVETSQLESTVKDQVNSALTDKDGVIQQAVNETVGESLNAKQDKLTAGKHITIQGNNTIDATGLIPVPDDECTAPSNLCVLTVNEKKEYEWVAVTVDTAE